METNLPSFLNEMLEDVELEPRVNELDSPPLFFRGLEER
jgi:hypothetical protein